MCKRPEMVAPSVPGLAQNLKAAGLHGRPGLIVCKSHCGAPPCNGLMVKDERLLHSSPAGRSQS